MPLYKMDNNLILPFEHVINEKHKNVQNDNIKTQEINKQSTKHTRKQAEKQTYRLKEWGNKGGHRPTPKNSTNKFSKALQSLEVRLSVNNNFFG